MHSLGKRRGFLRNCLITSKTAKLLHYPQEGSDVHISAMYTRVRQQPDVGPEEMIMQGERKAICRCVLSRCRMIQWLNTGVEAKTTQLLPFTFDEWVLFLGARKQIFSFSLFKPHVLGMGSNCNSIPLLVLAASNYRTNS